MGLNNKLLLFFSEQSSSSVLEQKTTDDYENVEYPGSEDEDQQVKVTNTTDVRELYAIAPPASFTDSSEDENGCTENSPLMRTEPTSFESTSSSEIPIPASSKKTSWETRPLLSRQLEIDHGSQSSKDTNLNSLDQEESTEKNSEECPPIQTTLNIVEDHDEVESQRVTPILFTLSPTRKGPNQVVSVVATRDLPAAFSRPLSAPTSPCTRKPVTIKTFRSPKSPRSFRGIFGCRSSSEKDIDKNMSDLKPEMSDENISSKTAENTISEKTLTDGSSNCEISKQQEHVLPNGDKQVNCDGGNIGQSKDTFIYTKNQTQACNTSKPDHNNPTDEADVSKSSSGEDAVIIFHAQPLPSRVPMLSKETSQRGDSNTNDSLEESTNNSDKGYESVDNSPCVEAEEANCPSLKANGTVPSNQVSKLSQNGISEKVQPNASDDITIISNEPLQAKRSVWLPLVDSRATAERKMVTAVTSSQPDCNLFSQTAV